MLAWRTALSQFTHPPHAAAYTLPPVKPVHRSDTGAERKDAVDDAEQEEPCLGREEAPRKNHLRSKKEVVQENRRFCRVCGVTKWSLLALFSSSRCWRPRRRSHLPFLRSPSALPRLAACSAPGRAVLLALSGCKSRSGTTPLFGPTLFLPREGNPSPVRCEIGLVKVTLSTTSLHFATSRSSMPGGQY